MCNDKAALDKANDEAEIADDKLYHGGRCLGAIIVSPLRGARTISHR